VQKQKIPKEQILLINFFSFDILLLSKYKRNKIRFIM